MRILIILILQAIVVNPAFGADDSEQDFGCSDVRIDYIQRCYDDLSDADDLNAAGAQAVGDHPEGSAVDTERQANLDEMAGIRLAGAKTKCLNRQATCEKACSKYPTDQNACKKIITAMVNDGKAAMSTADTGSKGSAVVNFQIDQANRNHASGIGL